MSFRITDAGRTANLQAQIAFSARRVAQTQEQVVTGKRINRPSDDPNRAEAVLRLRSNQAELAQYQRTATSVSAKLQSADTTLGHYQELLDRARALLAQGVTDTATPEARNAVATQLDSLRQQFIQIANTTHNGEYIFGGTRSTVAPFDPATGVANASTALPPYVQVEPHATPVVTSVTAGLVFTDISGTVFTALTNAVTALRGTGDATADRATLLSTQSRLGGFTKQANGAQAIIGTNQQYVAAARERLIRTNLALEESAQNIEGVDLAEAAIAYSEAQRSREAILQTAANTGRRSLLDFLG